MTLPAHTLAELCRQAARAFGPRLAVQHAGVALTYAELDAAAGAFAGWLRRAGLAPGDRVLLLLENSLEYVVAYFGLLAAGAVVVPLSPESPAAAVRRVLGDSGARAVVVRAAAGRALGLAPAAGPLVVPFAADFAENQRRYFAGPAAAEASGDGGALALILYTSGTCGGPKGVMLSHANVLANLRAVVAYLRLTAADSIVAVLPLCHAFGNSVLLTHLAVGAKVVLARGMTFPNALVELMQAERPSGFSGVPSSYYLLLHRSSFLARDWRFLRYVNQAGGAMRAAELRRLQAALPGTEIFVMYGQTEATARLSYLPPQLLTAKLGSVGRAIPGVELRVVDEAGVEVAPGEIGEIVARGANVMLGYLDAPEATARVLRDGWLHTGDLARRDADGDLYIVSRASDFIKCAAYRVGPGEVEEVIAELPEVDDVAVIGVEDEVLGEALLACVACAPARFDAERIREHCRGRLPSYKVPTYVVHEPHLPATASGKTRYGELRARYRGTPPGAPGRGAAAGEARDLGAAAGEARGLGAAAGEARGPVGVERVRVEAQGGRSG
jgi:long-chain acyl-CoA synthetase